MVGQTGRFALTPSCGLSGRLGKAASLPYPRAALFIFIRRRRLYSCPIATPKNSQHKTTR